MRIIGLDIHRAFAEAVAWQDGTLRRLGRVDMRRALLSAFASKLSPDDIVVVNGLQRVRPGTPVTPKRVTMGAGLPQALTSTG